MFWRRKPEPVAVGVVFARRRSPLVKEMARVVDVRPDRAGIRHVRFRVSIERPEREIVESEERTLAEDSFLQMFPERLESRGQISS